MKVFLPVLCLLIKINALSQSVYTPLNKEYNYLVDRYDIQGGRIYNDLHTSFKPYTREDVYDFARFKKNDSLAKFNNRDRFNLGYLQDDNWEWSDSAEYEGNSKKPVLKYFYKKKNSLYSLESKEFELQVNPVFYGLAGKENNSIGTNYINSRGIEVRGMVNRKVGFYTQLTTNQALFPAYVRERIEWPGLRAVPGESYFKPFRINAVDYFSARGYVTFRFSKNINFQFGHDKNFIGNGYRSLILSDYTAPYLFGKIQTKIWKLQYTNLYAQLFYNTNFGKDTTYNRKFLTLHHLSINIGKRLNIGLFESIVYYRLNDQFDLNYLNPVIFYRFVETYMGSGDKATVGFDMKLIIAKSVSLYSQVIINEFRINEIKSGKGWWGNKHAFQLGLKAINVGGLKNLDLQIETNVVRPYTYTSINARSNYSHYNQPLAHPLGANFVELLGLIRYQPQKRIMVSAKVILTRIGLDDQKQNYGSNIFIPYEGVISSRPYGNYITQGVPTNILYSEFNISYMIRHNLFLDFTQLFREQFTENENPIYRRTTTFTSIGLRYNMGQRQHEF